MYSGNINHLNREDRQALVEGLRLAQASQTKCYKNATRAIVNQRSLKSSCDRKLYQQCEKLSNWLKIKERELVDISSEFTQLHKYYKNFQSELILLMRTQNATTGKVDEVLFDRFDAAHEAFNEVIGVTLDSLLSAKRNTIENTALNEDNALGILNQKNFLERVNAEYARMSRTGNPACIVMVELDDLSLNKQRYGLQVVETALTVASQRFIDVLRPYDLIARLEDGRFVLCLPETSLQEAIQAMERIRKQIAHMPIFVDESTCLRVTASFGVSEIGNADVAATEALKQAEKALFTAKKAGKGCVRAHIGIADKLLQYGGVAKSISEVKFDFID